MFDFKEIKDGSINIVGLNSELECIYIDDLYKKNNSNILVVVNSIYEANKLYNSLVNYNHDAYLFLMDDFVTSEASISSPEMEITRLETLNSIVFNNEKKIIITNLMGLLRYLPNRDLWQNSKIDIKVNDEINKNELYRKLCGMGYKTQSLVTKTGEISNRGYILDIFPVGEENGIRIEFWGDVVDSIRKFDVNTQLSVKELNNIMFYPFSEFIVNCDIEEDKRLQKYLPMYVKVDRLVDYLLNPLLVYIDYSQIYNSYLRLEEEIVNYKEVNKENTDYMFSLEEFIGNQGIYISSVDDILPNVKIDEVIRYDSHDAPYYKDNFELLRSDLISYVDLGKTVVICLNNEHQVKNINKYLNIKMNFTTLDNIKLNSVNIVIHSITSGFIFSNYVFLSANNIFKNIENKSVYKSKFKFGTKINNVDTLNVGDYVVHNTHGIGRYAGIVALKKGDIVKDYLQIIYRDEEKLYIPVEKIEFISKYSSNDSIVPKLNKLGGTEWQKTKLSVKGRLRNIAAELLKTAAERKSKKGFAFPVDTPEQALFESEFMYQDTIDQLRATETIKKQMEDTTPMDVLLCGDVGYGKTEVAFRAIFKAVCANKQVAYLCPTTILSNQQYTSALSRFSSFPVNIALLNRFTTRKECLNIIEKLKNGQIDILFGTHRLLSDDVKFKDLGLLVVDEEQRFGVTHKEKIKKYKSNIDVLTLSATPIPRTLQMSMVGLRNLVLIETPPSDRYPVQTYVLEENLYVIKDAIYKELSRGGQIFILCNRIGEFDKRIKELTSLIPDINVGIAHGKMNKSEIEDIMFKFINKEFNVLLCTTIIETGIDIPNVNTLIILDADKFGLSQLYQIRGRVGRTNRIAYAYLMYGKNKVLNEIAVKRLSAIKEFAQLGSGFSIAMRDLSIRGAGDILGEEQSGFIDTIGIELYIKMLNEEVGKLAGLVTECELKEEIMPSLNVETHIDNDYVGDDKLKIEIHKMINSIDSYESLLKVKNEIEDRFGKISESMLVYMYEEWFESMKDKKGIDKVKQTDNSIEIIFNENMTKVIKPDKLFVSAYQVSKNFKLSYLNNRIVLTLSIINLKRHWIYYIIELLNTL